jgi:hypothetical protein
MKRNGCSAACSPVAALAVKASTNFWIAALLFGEFFLTPAPVRSLGLTGSLVLVGVVGERIGRLGTVVAVCALPPSKKPLRTPGEGGTSTASDAMIESPLVLIAG